MRLKIVTDLEGISGIDKFEMMDRETEGYQQARRLLMADVNAAVEGAIRGGASEIYVVDGHHGGGNFIDELLDSRAQFLSAADSGKVAITDFDATMLIGGHALAGTEKAFLDHTKSSKTWFSYTVNGKEYGELGMQAILCGMNDVPMIMISGDRAACEEARELIDNIVCVEVKSAQIRNVAQCIPVEEAHEKICAAAEDAVRRYRQIKNHTITLPATVAVTFTRSDYCDKYHKPHYTRRGRTLEKVITQVTCHNDLGAF